MFIGWKRNLAKMSTLPQLTYKFHTISVKIPTDFFFLEIDRLMKSIWKYRGPRIAKTIVKNKA